MTENKLRTNVLEEYLPIIQGYKRYNLIYGGRAGGRSYFASQYAQARLFKSDYFRCGIMRYVQGDIRNSIFQEIVDRIEENGINDPLLEIRDHALTINFKKNTINGIGFRKSSSDQKAKLKSLAGYTDIIIEEAEEVAEEDFIQLDDSLRKIGSEIRIFLLFNLPDKNHWIIKRWFNLLDSGIEGFYIPEAKESEKHNTQYCFATYKNNEINLNETTIANFERYKTERPDHYWNMIMGLVPSGKRGIIFKDWKPITIEEFNELPYSSFYGMDFGFSSDPTALVEIKEHNNKVWLRELIYETGLTNQKIAKRLDELGVERSAFIYADSAEPKSIEEIHQLGWNILPSTKGKDSINAGISMLLDREICYTEGSTNLVREIQEYRWALDKNKEPTNKPIDDYNHILDSCRYGILTHNTKPFIGFV